MFTDLIQALHEALCLKSVLCWNIVHTLFTSERKLKLHGLWVNGVEFLLPKHFWELGQGQIDEYFINSDYIKRYSTDSLIKLWC